MRRSIAYLACALTLLLVLAMDSRAALITTEFGTVVTWVEGRSTALDGVSGKTARKERRTLKRAGRLLAKDSQHLKTDARVARKLVRQLERHYGDLSQSPEQFAADLSTALFELEFDLGRAVHDLDDVVDALPEGRQRDRAIRLLGIAGPPIGELHSAQTFGERTDLMWIMGKALARLDRLLR